MTNRSGSSTEQQRGIHVYGMADWSRGLTPLEGQGGQNLNDSQTAERYAREQIERGDNLQVTGIFRDGKPQTFFQREGNQVVQYDCVPHSQLSGSGAGATGQSAR